MERGGDAENYIVALVWGDVTGGWGVGGSPYRGGHQRVLEVIAATNPD